MSVLPVGFGSAAAGGTPANAVERSLRFNSADTAYLNRTPGSAGNRRIFTFSAWIKRSQANALVGIMGAGVNADSTQTDLLGFDGTNGNSLLANFGDGTYFVTTVAVLRDFSAWYHVVFAIDTTQATNTNRVKIYLNGVQQTLSGTYPPQNYDSAFNTTNFHTIGSRSRLGAASNYLNGYLTEVNFINALTPNTTTRTVNGVTETILTELGQFNANTGVWEPAAWTRAFGTNGFFLKFADNSNNTAATLGKDSSGNGNNWTPNLFIVSPTTSVNNDSMVDSPTAYGTDTGVGGEVRGNYCTLNPLNKAPSDVVLSNGNLEAASSFTSDHRCFAATFQVTSGKWYWEVQYATGTISAGSNIVGIFNLPTPDTANNRRPADSVNNGIGIRQDGQSESDNTSAAYFGSSIAVGDIIGIKLDADAGTVAFNVNGGSFGSTLTFVSAGGVYTPGGDIRASSGTPKTIHNFGQRAFAYTAPSGFKALCTQNLTYTHTIGATSTTQAGKYFNPVLYTGNGSTQSITGVGFQPDWVWVKSRSSSGQHSLTDAVRGVNKQLFTSLTDAEGSQTDQVTAFNSDGFSLGANVAGTGSVNVNTITYAAWNWKANGAGVSNTVGQITSTVSANNDAGFSIVTFTGNGSANQTVGHGCKVGGVATAPAFGILKDRDTNSNNNQWQVFHTAAGDQYGYLSTTAAFTGTAEFYPTTSSTTTVTVGRGSPVATTNESGDRYVMYLFAPVPGYSAFGSYTGNGSSTDGVFIYLGFRPRYVLIKRTNTTENWHVMDTARNSYNAMDASLYPNLANSEVPTSGHAIDFLSNGIKMRNNNTGYNASSSTYIYAAFAESPFKYSLAR